MMKPSPRFALLTAALMLMLTLMAAAPARADDSVPGGSAVADDAESHSPDCDAPPEAAPRARARPKRTFGGDVNRPWFHVGGGGGVTVLDLEQRYSVRTGRFVVGGGRYVPFFYGGGQFEISGSQFDPVKLTAVGFAGLAPPIPVFHPMVGVRFGGGHHMTTNGMQPHLTLGPQAGFILRKFDSRGPGVRVMVDAGLDWRFKENKTTSDLMVTVAAVF